MIEKFSEEELKQIKKELGIEKNVRKKSTLSKEILNLNKLWEDKEFAKDNCVLNVIDYTLCNVEKSYYSSKHEDKFRVSLTVKPEDENEYRQMFQEILEIIKKHNRKWEGDKE